MTATFTEGDRVQIYIPDPGDPDHRHHGREGTISHILEDDLDQLTGKPRDSGIYTIEFEDGERAGFRSRDLRMPEDSE